MEKYNKYHESLNIDCGCGGQPAAPRPKKCCGGISLPSKNNNKDLLLHRIKEEIRKLMQTTTARLLCQDKKIAETMVYVKNNLSNSIRDLLASMQDSGELDRIIAETITDISDTVTLLEEDAAKFYIYNPSLINSVESESIALVMNTTAALLFDAGRDTSATNNVAYLRQKLGARKLDAVIISHYHTDHVGGLAALIPLMDRQNTIVYLPMNFANYYNGTDDADTIIQIRDDVIALLEQNRISYVEVDTDRVLCFGEMKVELRNSNPCAYAYYDEHQSRYNAYSMNALVSVGDNKVLFPGDSLVDTQDYLLSVGQVEKVSVYASAHHGYERRQNSEYLDILNPDYEYFSVSPLSWDAVSMTNYDYVLRNKPVQYTTQAFGEVEYMVSKTSTIMLKGYFAKENMFVNKRIDIYVDPNFAGAPDGSLSRPFRSLSQAVSYIPDADADVTIHLGRGVYEDVRFMDVCNLLQVTTEYNDVVIRNLQINNCSAIYFNGIFIEGNVVANYGHAYFNDCRFDCHNTASGNINVTLNRINASFNNCTFDTAYTGVYAQSGAQVVVRNSTINAATYAIYGINSYIAIDGIEINGGTLREDVGCTIKASSKGNSSAVPVFNDSNYMRGYEYFATNLGYPLFYYNHDGADHWVKADGTEVI